MNRLAWTYLILLFLPALALAFYAFKKSLAAEQGRQTDPPANITDAELLAAIGKAADWLKSSFGSVRVPYGRYFRVGRQGGDRTFPVGGGSLSGGANNVAMATPRAISFRLRFEICMIQSAPVFFASPG